MNHELNPAPFSSGERGLVAAASFPASIVVVAYFFDLAGVPLTPAVVLPAALAITGGILWLLRDPVSQAGREAIAAGLLVCGIFAWLLWRAAPEFLPLGSGPDLVHHLSLIEYIRAHRSLVHDPGAVAFLAEMAAYTPGSHIMVALTASVMRLDGVQVLHGVVALTVAIKSGFVLLIALRVLGDVPGRLPLALAAVALLLVPEEYFLGSFMADAFIAQAVSEMFAVAMWWALVVWDEQTPKGALALFGLFGAATFLTWPVWIGPPVIAFGAVALLRTDLSWPRRLNALFRGGWPIALTAAVFAASRLGAFGIAGTSGAVMRPSLHVYGWLFTALFALGAAIAPLVRRARATVFLLLATAMQSLVLFIVARRRGADTPYLALKMFFLAVYPQAVLASVGLAAAWQGARRLPVVGRLTRLAWVVPIAIGVSGVRGLSAAQPRMPAVTESLRQAGLWANGRTNPECVDYLVHDWVTAYWLHVNLLGNSRMSRRTGQMIDGFDDNDNIARWVVPRGLPHAIVEDLNALPNDARANMSVLARFGKAAVVERRGPHVCGE